MSQKVKVAGSWKNMSDFKVRVSGAWKEVDTAKVRVAGVWKTYYTRATPPPPIFIDVELNDTTSGDIHDMAVNETLTLTSEGYPIAYPLNKLWNYVVNPSGGAVTLNIDLTGDISDPGYDYLKIYEGTDNTGTLLYTLEHAVVNHLLLHSVAGGSLFFEFKSDSAIIKPGFTAIITES